MTISTRARRTVQARAERRESRNGRRLLGLVIVTFTVATFLTAATSSTVPMAKPPMVSRLADTNQPAVASRLELGTTLTQHAYDAWGDPGAVDLGRRVLAGSVRYQAQHLMGWGALNPQPGPTSYDWASLDARMATIAASGSEPVLILCCSPDWMHGGKTGTTDWAKLGVAPDPAHYHDFAALAAKAAERYPAVTHFVIWNEMKGFYDASTNNWNVDGYISLWKQTAAAIRAVRPDALIGGPYVVVDSFSTSNVASDPSSVRGTRGTIDQRSLDLLSKFLAATNADFLALDSSTTPRGARWPSGDAYGALDKFAVIDNWLRQRTTLPIWWMEYYPQPEAARWTPETQATIEAETLLRMAYSGASTAFLWGPNPDGSGRPSLTTSVGPGGGQATPTAVLFTTLRRVLRPGVTLRPMTSNNWAIVGWRVGATTIIINRSDSSLRVQLPNGHEIAIAPRSITTTTT